MSDKKSILLVTTQYRAGERIYPIIPHLAKEYNIDLIKLYQMHPNHVWKGNKDMRTFFNQKYSKFFNQVYTDVHSPSYSNYTLILTDDNRAFNGLPELYKKRKCLVIANSHGNTEHGYETKNLHVSFDGCFVFGTKESTQPHHIPGGIPCNDVLNKYLNIPKEHILIILNQLGNYGQASTGNGDYFKLFNKDFFEKIDICKIQKYYNKPVVLKLKSRDDGPPLQHNIEYLHSILPKGLDYKIVIDVGDDNLLIAQSIVVIGATSTLAFKPIQLGIPTALIKGYGQTGLFANYLGLTGDSFEEVMEALKLPKQNNFIQETIQGGLTWNSTEYYLDYIKQLINK